MSQPIAPNDKPKFYLTTPIYYANSRPHVGSAYTTIVCDVIARYKRMCGFDVAYLTGTDEHGVNIERAAEVKGITPQQLVDKNEAIFRDLWKLLGITHTDFIRTTSAEHARAVETLVRRTMERDEKLPLEKRSIYKAKYEGRYCIYDNLYVSDTPEPAKCPTCGRDAELISEENYFFRLSAYGNRLLDLYEKHPEFVQPDFRRNEVISFVKSGLKDVSISRKTIKWGIPWPGDPEHVFYVWYDALTSYMSGIGYASEDKKRQDEFTKFWPADLHMIGKEIIRFHAVYWPAFLMAAELPLPKQIFAHGWLLFEQEKMSKSKGNVAYPEPIVKVLGNDALRYYLLREVVFGQDGNFSREALITRYNADLANGLGNLASRILTMIARYRDGIWWRQDRKQFFPLSFRLIESFDHLRECAVAQFEHYDFAAALQSIWELIARTDVFLTCSVPWGLATDEQNWKPTWPATNDQHGWEPPWEPRAWQAPWQGSLEPPWAPKYERARWGVRWPKRFDIPRWRSRWSVATPKERAEFVREPALAVGVGESLGEFLDVAAETLRCICVLAHPVLPKTTEAIWQELGFQDSLEGQRIDCLVWGEPKAEVRIGKVAPLFPRIEKTEALGRIETMEQEIRNPGSAQPATDATTTPKANPSEPAPTSTGAAAPAVAPASTKITIDDFAKVELRVGIVKSAERIQGADKLLKLMVDIGDEVRQVLAGIALGYTPEELVGRKVVMVTNLAPRKMRGLESNGMLLAASAGADGKPVLCTFAEDIPVGSKVK